MRALSAGLLGLLPLFAAALPACEIAPNYVENGDIDDAMARSNFKTVCKGLEMKDDDTRRYAASKMKEITDPIAKDCVCQFIGQGKNGWDAAIADGIKGSDRDDLAGCFAPIVAKADLAEREAAVVALAQIPAPIARKTLGEIAAAPGGASEVRVRAIGAVAGSPDFSDMLIGLLQSDPDPVVRTAAADGLGAMKDPKITAALSEAYGKDEDGTVRAAALIGMKKAGVPEADALVCKAMMEDPSPDVRSRAIGAFRGTKRPEAVACLRERALKFEEDGNVREQLLAVLKSSPRQEAADVLCDAIPFFMRSYVKEALPEKIPGTDIAKVQNDRDWERSYACFQKAVAQSGGYSCPAKMYTAFWFREVGGNAFIPKCPGIE